ncbi:MAG: NAD(P)/FAD-dependent oxidoreductase [Gammaproteobacteria bacterium]|nr:NAD(P)/FAD-dependent oxidoreductase [Gammaproteobacteria bacterium]
MTANHEQNFDLVVVGTGVAASTVASRCNKAGWRVAVVDERPYGGTCQLRGCDPKKVLRRGAEVIAAAQRMHGKGIDGDEALQVDWPALMAFKKTFTDSVPESKEQSFRENGIETFHGKAAFIDERTLEVGEAHPGAEKIVLANGAEPAPLPFDGAGHLLHSDEFMELENLPRRLVFVGGGYITFEFAHLAVRAGAEVTILEMGERPLAPFDADLVAQLVERSRIAGIDIHVNAEVQAITKVDGEFSVRTRLDGETRVFDADGVVHGAGRVPATEGLELERGGVEYGKAGIKVNDYLQSPSNAAVYAAGDVAETRGLPLTPVAGLEGGVVASNLLEGNATTVDYAGIPSCVFTIPPLATVGMSEADANEQDTEVHCRYSDMSNWYPTRRVGETHAAAKVLLEKRSGRVLGAHLFGPQCDEMINFFGLAIRKGWSGEDLREIVSAYPSAASYIVSLV